MADNCTPGTCCVCGGPLGGRRAGTLTCSGKCRIALWRIGGAEGLQLSVTRPRFKSMSHEAYDMNRPAVAELLALTPMQMRALECGDANFPKPRQIEPGVFRWSRAELLAWAARNRGVESRPERSYQTRVV